ncbi:MAG: HU family DNA-binding protein [Ruminococcus sp.]|nr:HU family DNA-binding protein [Ruminococcus sp.]
MIKEGVITDVCRKTMYSRSMVETIVDAILDTVTDSLAKGEKVQFAGFGTFEPKQCSARTGRNPHTNEKVPIPARVVPHFRAGKYLKDAVIKPTATKQK